VPAKKMKYVGKRGGNYRYYRRVPQAVIDIPSVFEQYFRSQPTFRESLNTADENEAMARGSIVGKRFDEKVELALGDANKIIEHSARSQPVTMLDLQRIAKDQKDSIVFDWAEDIRRAQVNEEAAEFLHGKLENELAHREKEAKTANSVLPTDRVLFQARAINSNWGFNVPESSEQFADILLAVKDGMVEGYRQVDEIFHGAALPTSTRSTVIKSFENNPSIPGAPETISDVITFQENNSDFSAKTLLKKRRSQSEFISLIGDKPINQIERNEILKFLEMISRRTTGADAAPVSKGTIQSDLSAISSVIGYAISRGWREGPNPAADIDLDAFVKKTASSVTPNKRRFHDDELSIIFKHPWFAGCQSAKHSLEAGDYLITDSRFWVPVVALYTGARASELGGLKVDEVHFQPVPHIVLQPNEFRRIKSNEVRKVPILNVLLELGFEKYLGSINRSRSERVFPDWVANQAGQGDERYWQWSNGNIIRGFHRNVLNKLLPKDPNHSRSPISFHSFRGSFKKLMYDSGHTMLANNVIGHAIEQLDQRYIGSVDVSELHAAFHELKFAHLDIPPRS
jgi:integrase